MTAECPYIFTMRRPFPFEIIIVIIIIIIIIIMNLYSANYREPQPVR